MSDTAAIADRYIARDGGPPKTSGTGARICVADAGDIIKLATYLGYTPKDETFGGVQNAEAWLAFCRIVGLPADEFRRVVTE